MCVTLFVQFHSHLEPGSKRSLPKGKAAFLFNGKRHLSAAPPAGHHAQTDALTLRVIEYSGSRCPKVPCGRSESNYLTDTYFEAEHCSASLFMLSQHPPLLVKLTFT